MKVSTKELYRPKEFATLAGVTVRALHHYDRLGLLKPRQRTSSGYRLYSDGTLPRTPARCAFCACHLRISQGGRTAWMRAVASFPSVQSIHPKRLLMGIFRPHPDGLSAIRIYLTLNNRVRPYCKNYESMINKSMAISTLMQYL